VALPTLDFQPQGPATTFDAGDEFLVAPSAPAGSGTTPQGPSDTSRGGTEGLRGSTVSGAINVVAIHPTNPSIVYVGTVSGGIWKTTDINRTDMAPLDFGANDPLREAAPDTAANGTTAGFVLGPGNTPTYLYQWSGQKSGGDSAVRSEFFIAGMIFHPSRVKS